MKMKYAKFLERFEGLKTEIAKLEDTGIPLSASTKAIKSNQGESVSISYLLQVLKKLHQDLEILDGLHSKVRVKLRFMHE